MLDSGGVALYFMSIEPLMSIAAARSWTPAVCTIESSAVKQHDGRSYSVVIAYSYIFQGKLFHSDRYNFLACPSSLRGWRDRVVAGYPPGLVATCYVNPPRPSEAVLNRNLHPDFLWGQCSGPPLLIPLLLFVIGLALIGGSVWFRRRERQRAQGVLSQANAPDRRPVQVGSHDGPITLEPEIRRVTQAGDRFFWRRIMDRRPRVPRLLGIRQGPCGTFWLVRIPVFALLGAVSDVRSLGGGGVRKVASGDLRARAGPDAQPAGDRIGRKGGAFLVDRWAMAPTAVILHSPEGDRTGSFVGKRAVQTTPVSRPACGRADAF